MNQYKGFTGFFSERTADFVIASRMITILKSQFQDVIPVYPWISREGGRLSRILHENDSFRVLGVYSKRPKLSTTISRYVVKVNHNFVEGALAARQFEIPFVTGSPLVREFWGLNNEACCFWAILDENTEEYYEIEDIESNVKLKDIFHNNHNIVDYILNNSEEISLDVFISAIREIRLASGGGIYRFFGQYRPLYFLLR